MLRWPQSIHQSVHKAGAHLSDDAGRLPSQSQFPQSDTLIRRQKARRTQAHDTSRGLTYNTSSFSCPLAAPLRLAVHYEKYKRLGVSSSYVVLLTGFYCGGRPAAAVADKVSARLEIFTFVNVCASLKVPI